MTTTTDTAMAALSAEERDNAIECIAQALAAKVFDFGYGNRDLELREGAEYGEIVVDALVENGWTLLGTDEADEYRAFLADHPTRPGTGAAGERGYGRVAYTAFCANVLAHAPHVSWDDASPTIQAVWGASSNAVRDAVLRDLADPAAGERERGVERAAWHLLTVLRDSRIDREWGDVDDAAETLEYLLAAAPDDKE